MSAAGHGRPLTAGERAICADAFGDAVDPASVRLHRRRWWPLHPRGAVMAPDGHLWFHPAGDLWSEDFTHERLGLRALLVHELTHVWQAQRSGRWWLPLMRHPFCRYGYTLVPGQPFRRYGIEQQAEIAKDAWLLRQGRVVPGKPPLAAYAAILPFPCGPLAMG